MDFRWGTKMSFREVRNPHKTAESFGPTCISQEGVQYGAAEKLSAGSELRGNGELAQPAVVLTATVRVVESSLKRKREIFGKEDFWPGTKRDPLVPVVLRITVFGSLVDENWHDGEPVVRLKDHLFCDQKPCRAVYKRGGIIYRCTEVARRSGSVLDAERVVPSVPLETLMAQSERVSIRRRNYVVRY